MKLKSFLPVILLFTLLSFSCSEQCGEDYIGFNVSNELNIISIEMGEALDRPDRNQETLELAMQIAKTKIDDLLD